jgi:secondary thiamine-phosphate synthase enzyme
MILHVSSERREQVLDITSDVRAAIRELGIDAGAVLVACPHTTAALTLNENADPAVAADLLDGLRRLVPRDGGWAHSEGNSDAHLKASLLGSSVLLAISDGELVLGTWQGVLFCEFDGPRQRRVHVHRI